MENFLSVYVHIPFCVRKCNYCDFLSFSCKEDAYAPYVRRLCEEIRLFGRAHGKDYTVRTIFLGGGTPSILPLRLIEEIATALKDSFSLSADCEWSIECNPGTVDRAKLSFYRSLGMNRVSFGLQSADDEELARLGRIHTYTDFLSGYGEAIKSGFTNINIDLINGIPGQSLASYEKTLRKVLMLKPQHISAYSLIVEENTPFGDAYARGEELDLPKEDDERAMYSLTGERLKAAGFTQYEFSNYAKKDHLCRHNLTYWERGEYVGFGLGAASLLRCKEFPMHDGFNDTRVKNLTSFEQYEKAVDRGGIWETDENGMLNAENFAGVEALDKKACMEEFMFLGLRKTSGIREDDFRLTFGQNIDKVYEEPLRKYTDLGYLIRENARIRLSQRGIAVSNVILSDFLLD